MPIYKLGVVTHPDEPADDPRRPARPRLQDRGRQVRRRRRRHRRAARERPAGARRHGRASRRASTCPSCCAKRGIPHEVLNAKQHAREAAIVAQAGRKGAVTVATNMAGRGTDIMLGGNAEFMAVAELQRRGLDPVETPEEYEAAWPDALAEDAGDGRGRARRGRRARRALRARHRAARVAPHRQPAARPLRPAGRPRREPVLPVAQDDLMRLFNSGHGRVVPATPRTSRTTCPSSPRW